ncbi:MAG: cytochrome c family protein [Deltaproteobacteria bacterium]|nr:cytochrome c family protein [Deltaproteobacteria bacterium]
MSYVVAIANRWTMAARTSWTLGAFFVIAVAFCTGPGAALGEETSAHRFVGAAKCKTCHKKEGIGNQYGIWLESKHAKAYETLAGEQAAEWAADVGIADPQADEKCVKCHVTAYGVPEERLSRKFKKTLGVQCEAEEDHDRSGAGGLEGSGAPERGGLHHLPQRREPGLEARSIHAG